MKKLLFAVLIVLLSFSFMGCGSEQEEMRTIEGWAIYAATEHYGENAFIIVETYDYMWIDNELQSAIAEQEDRYTPESKPITVYSQYFKITLTSPDDEVDQETIYYVVVMWEAKWWYNIAEPRYFAKDDILVLDTVEAIE